MIQELIALRSVSNEEFDSDSVDNAIRLCEKMDICFESLDGWQKLLFTENFKFFSSSYQLILFVKLMFRGGLASKEITFRSFSRKLKATSEVIRCILSTKTLFESPEIEEEVQHGFKSFIDTLASNFANLIPPSIRATTKNPLSVTWLQTVLSQEGPIFNESEVPYPEVVRQFTDLLYALFSNDQLTFYLKWKDQYLRHWLLEGLRKEDLSRELLVPALSTAKAELYVEYINWTKISKRLNANLRHRQTFTAETTIRAEKILLDRFPSSVLQEVVFKLKKQMAKVEKLPEVDLGVDESSLDEVSLYNDMVDDIVEEEGKREGTSWMGNLVQKLKEAVAPKIEEPKISLQFIERVYPQKLLPTVTSSRMPFGEEFPKNYSAEIPEQYSSFFSRSRTSFYTAFEESVLEILMVYEENDLSCIANTPHELTWSDNDQPFEFEEHSLALLVEEKNLILLGNSYFTMSFKDYNRRPDPYGYFKWFEKVESPQKGKEFCMVDDQCYREAALDQAGADKEVFQGLTRVIDSLPDESREKNRSNNC